MVLKKLKSFKYLLNEEGGQMASLYLVVNTKFFVYNSLTHNKIANKITFVKTRLALGLECFYCIVKLILIVFS